MINTRIAAPVQKKSELGSVSHVHCALVSLEQMLICMKFKAKFVQVPLEQTQPILKKLLDIFVHFYPT
jgi:hypothetical protein